MQLFIPPLGTKLSLCSDWNFSLFVEHRNMELIRALFTPPEGLEGCYINHTYDYAYTEENERYLIDKSGWYAPSPSGSQFKAPCLELNIPSENYSWDNLPWFDIFLPKGTVISFVRYYIRNGAKDFDSVTFTIQKTSHPLLQGVGKKKAPKYRFWAKLSDVNQMDVEILN